MNEKDRAYFNDNTSNLGFRFLVFEKIQEKQKKKSIIASRERKTAVSLKETLVKLSDIKLLLDINCNETPTCVYIHRLYYKSSLCIYSCTMWSCLTGHNHGTKSTARLSRPLVSPLPPNNTILSQFLFFYPFSVVLT